MKNCLFILLILNVFSGLSLNAQIIVPSISPFTQVKAQDNLPTSEASNTIWLQLKEDGIKELNQMTYSSVNISLNLPGEGVIELTLLKSCPFSDIITVGQRSLNTDGDIIVTTTDVNPKIKTFDIIGEGLGGSFVLFSDYLIASIRYKDRVFELRSVDLNESYYNYVLFDVNDSRFERNMTCKTDELVRRSKINTSTYENKSSNIECVEVAIDIDYYTYNTFGNCDDAINWSLAILAGVDEIYRTSLDDLITLQASYINIWQTIDPYAEYIEDSGAMLDAFRTTWLSDNALASTNHDLVHLMTKRSDTGTGGIAWIDGVCNDYGFGFSSYLDNETSFVVPNYSWNLNVVGHELGHNFGSHHTHWCGWPGGPIDNCSDLEGNCSGYSNNPQGQLGTMMSYCHAISGGSVTLEFHETVINYALSPSLNAATCHSNCAAIETSCGSVYGCTDSSSCNFNPNASVDDGSCGDFDVCGICLGDGSSCSGCIDMEACNYDPEAIYTNDSCIYPPEGYECDCETQVSVLASLSAYESAETIFEATGVFTSINITLDFINTSNGGSWAGDILVEIVSPTGECVSIGGYDVISMCSSGTSNWPSFWNVTSSGNYTASYDFSSSNLSGNGEWTYRIINGWSSSSLVEYNMTSTLIGVCSGPPTIIGCPEDLNNDEFVTVGDVLILLGEFNCMLDCFADVDGDGSVSVNDLLMLLAAFGSEC